MRPGSGAVRLVQTAPLDLTKALYDLVVGVGCHVVITPTPIDPVGIGDAAALSQALYTGRVVARPDRLSLEFMGISTWLDSYNETAISRTAGTPTQWVGDVLLNNITSGTISGGSNVTASYPAHAQTRRQILDDVAKLGSWEYEFRPNFTINAGTSVFTTTPTVVITNRDEGPDGTYTGLLGGLLDQGVDASNVVTKVTALGQGAGSSIVTGSATKTPNLKTQNGNTPTIVQVISAPSVSSANVGTVATVVNTAANVAFSVGVSSVMMASGATVGTGATRGGSTAPVANTPAPTTGGGGLFSSGPNGGATVNTSPTRGPAIFQRPGGNEIDSPRNPEIVDPGGFADVPLQRAIEAATRAANEYASSALAMVRTSSTINSPAAESQFIRRVVRPGDSVYLYDLESGLFDTSTQITYRGETIFPLTKRVLSMTWAIEQGYGVYVRSNASTPVWYDLTPHVEWEAPGATLEVGDRPADSFPGVVNRSNPDIEERVSSVGEQTFTPVLTADTVNPTVTYTTQTGFYERTATRVIGDGRIVINTVTGAGTGVYLVTLPVAPKSTYFNQAIGSAFVIDNGTNDHIGTVYAVPSVDGTKARVLLEGGTAWNSGGFAVAAGDSISYVFNYSTV